MERDRAWEVIDHSNWYDFEFMSDENWFDYFDGLAQNCSNSSVSAMELQQSFPKPLIWILKFTQIFFFEVSLTRWGLD